MLRSLTCITGIVLFVLTVAAAPAAAADCVVFEGFKHCALGTADLDLVNQGAALRVSTFDPNGGDGVAVDLGSGVTSWNALYNWRSAPGDSLDVLAISNGLIVSRSTVVETSKNFQISAEFTGSSSTGTHSAFVYRDGQLVGSVGGLTTFPPVVLEPIDFCDLHPNAPLCDWLEGFRNTALGECEWSYRFGSNRTFELPGGQRLVGDELRLLEELDPRGHYPYVSFDEMQLTTSGDGLQIRAESAD